ncbi:MAG: hypothetical protein QM527_06520 [Alphaproteobacteria bacterium]|nr:hypothetical protein [Alphaproteobacteria bacterium]
MFSLHCTKKLLDRIKPELEAPRAGTTRLGNWYATALFWKPQMALVVNERTLLPVLLPLAPAATLAQRFPIALRDVLQALDMPAEFIDSEISGMSEVVYAKTANRSILGVMNEFVYLAEGYREQDGSVDPVWLSLRLAGTPCGPLYKGAVFPDKAVRELIQGGVIH